MNNLDAATGLALAGVSFFDGGFGALGFVALVFASAAGVWAIREAGKI